MAEFVDEILAGDARAQLARLPANHVQMVMTSPPYYGLRDYGTATWVGGEAACPHAEMLRQAAAQEVGSHSSLEGSLAHQRLARQGAWQHCPACGAQRQDAQLGLEATPERYVTSLVEVFREVRRVLRPDGTLWLVLGDSYVGYKGERYNVAQRRGTGEYSPVPASHDQGTPHTAGLGNKQLLGLPWRVALALQADGWILRADIIWDKANCLPESVKDRPTKSHEYLFLLAKRERYYYNADAIRDPLTYPARTYGPATGHKTRALTAQGNRTTGGLHDGRTSYGHPAGRNKRSVWRVSTQPYRGAHFAVFPPRLITPCILAGSRPGDIVLDPFFGSGTTGLVALRFKRHFVGIELNPAYIDLARQRLAAVPVELFAAEEPA